MTTPSPIHEALAQAVLPDLVKDSQNDYLKSSYVSMPQILTAVRPALGAVGVVISSGIQPVHGGFALVTTLTHAQSGTSVSSAFPIADVQPSKIAQAAGWGMRVNLLQLLAISPSDPDAGTIGHQGGGMLPAGVPAFTGEQAMPPAAMPPAAMPPAAMPPAAPPAGFSDFSF